MSLPREDVTISWPAPTLPGVCARTGLATRDGVVLTPRGATYEGAEVIVPFSNAAQLRQRALRRLAVLAGLVAIACVLGGIFAAAFFLVPAIVAIAVSANAAHDAHHHGIFPVLHGRELTIPGAHPAFAAAVAAMPERCGGAAGGGCETCLSACLPQAVAV